MSVNCRGTGIFRLRGAWSRALVCLLWLASPFWLPGCGEEPEPDKGANQSLVEIGERSLEMAEELESDDKRVESHLAYKRALWAFRYHEQLTGEEPFLLDEALDGMERTAP